MGLLVGLEDLLWVDVRILGHFISVWVFMLAFGFISAWFMLDFGLMFLFCVGPLFLLLFWI